MPIILTRKGGSGGGGCPDGESCYRDASTGTYDADVAGSNPRVYYKGDDASGALQDSSANNLDMTTNTNIGYRTACDGPLVGIGDFSLGIGNATVASRAVASTAVNNISMEMWVLPLHMLADGAFFQNGTNTTGYYVFYDQPANKFALVMPNSAGPFASTGDLTLGQWAYIVVVRDAGTWKFYLNGAVDNASVSAAAPVAPTGTTSIGGSGSVVGAAFLGARFALYETALSAATIAARYAIATT